MASKKRENNKIHNESINMKRVVNEIKPNICVVVVVKNRIEFTKRFLNAFKKSTYKNYEIVLVDDGSTDGTEEMIKKDFPQVILLKGNGNLWWAGGTNKGVKFAIKNNFDYVLTINNDAVVNSKYLENLVKCAIKFPNSLIGSLITRNDNNNIWSVGGHLDWNSNLLFKLNFFDESTSKLKGLHNPYKAEILNGDGTLIPTAVFRKIGLYNAFFTPQYHADSEIVLRAAKHGFDAYVCLDAKLHNEISTIPLITTKKDLVFYKKSDYFWRPLLFLYIKYAPVKYYLGFFKQYYPFFKDMRGIARIRRIYGKIKARLANRKN